MTSETPFIKLVNDYSKDDFCNDPGDREKAFKALSGAFEEVYEIPYISTPIKKEKEGFDECH